MNHFAAFLNPNLSAEELQSLVESDLEREGRLIEQIKTEALYLRKNVGPEEASKTLPSIAEVHLRFGNAFAGTFAACAAAILDAQAQRQRAREESARWRVRTHINREWIDFLEKLAS